MKQRLVFVAAYLALTALSLAAAIHITANCQC